MRKKIIHTGGTNCYSNFVFERTQYKKPNIRIDIFDEDVACDGITRYSTVEWDPDKPPSDDDEEYW